MNLLEQFRSRLLFCRVDVLIAFYDVNVDGQLLCAAGQRLVTGRYLRVALGAKVVPVTFGGQTLKEAVDSAFQSYLEQADTTLFAIGSVVGPHPFPKMVRTSRAW